MRLADFILSDLEAILTRWQAFAATNMPAAAHMNALALRDHAQQILEAVVADLRTTQTREAQGSEVDGSGAQNHRGTGDSSTDPCFFARPQRIRHPTTGRRVSRSATKRTEPVDE